jgi:hypothetical protein
MTAEPWRVAQIAVDQGPDHEDSLGSGYLIGPGRVLTAAHVLAGARVVWVWLDVGQEAEIEVQAESWWADPVGHEGTDLAVITIPQTATAGRTFESVKFGRISDCTAVLMVEAFGFPLFKLRDDRAEAERRGVLRDFEHATGHAKVAANRRTGSLAVYLDDPPVREPSEGEPSPWEGMSGGPVWNKDRIVAVVAEHHLAEGTVRLTARRIDRAYEELSTPDLSELVAMLGLPSVADELPDVVPAGQERLKRLAYRDQVRDIAPDLLVGRDDELAEWVDFCAGVEPYAWWQGGPWAGKSALAAWFVLYPPAGVDVVSFFITSRLGGQADSEAFLDAMIEQLNSLYPAIEKFPAVAGARAGAWLALLASAAAEARREGRRLVVVVDGLDEDQAGASPAIERPSIASLLPRRPPRGVRFIVTSRPDPGLPDDLHANHPLRTCKPHRLAVSPVAEGIALSAKLELDRLLKGDRIAIAVVGCIAGSGGGLTRSDLSALIEAPPYKLDPVLRGVFGRSLYTRASTDPRNPQADPATRVYLFAHETLRVIAEEKLGSDLLRYRGKVHAWIASYANEGWPGATPGYAIRGYPRLLTATADLTRLSALARDPHRHAFLFAATGSDYAALTEIGSAQRLLADQEIPDLRALVELAAYDAVISMRNESIPDDLPIVWERLARFDHAESLARSLDSPKLQALALTGMVTVAAESGDLARANRLAADAEALARTIADREDQTKVLASLIAAIAGAGDLDRASRLAADAEALARTIADPYAQGQVLASLAPAIAQAGDVERAEALARTPAYPGDQARALSDLAIVAAIAGDLARAKRLGADAEALINSYTDVTVLAGLVTAIARAGDVDRAEVLARTRPDAEAQTLVGLATVVAEAGDVNSARRLAADAERLARTIIDPYPRVQILLGLTAIAAEAGDVDRASQLTADAEGLARTIAAPYPHTQVRAGLIVAIAKAGDLVRAEAVARAIPDGYTQAGTLTALAAIAAESGDLGRAIGLADAAEAVARTFTSREDQAELLSGLAAVAADAGDLDRASRLAAAAETLAGTLTDPDARAQVLSRLADVAADVGDLDHVNQLADAAEALAGTLANHSDRTEVLSRLATAMAKAGDLDRAAALAGTLTDSDAQAETVSDLAIVAADLGDVERANQLAAKAEALIRTRIGRYSQAQAVTSLVIAIAKAGDPERAEALADALTDSDADADDRAAALVGLATVAYATGDRGRANRLAAEAEALARTITHPFSQAQVLAGLVTAFAKAGELDRAEVLSRTITYPHWQARALTDLATAFAESGDVDRAAHLLAKVLVMDVSDVSWIRTVSQFFPSAIGDLWDILAGVYTKRLAELS